MIKQLYDKYIDQEHHISENVRQKLTDNQKKYHEDLASKFAQFDTEYDNIVGPNKQNSRLLDKVDFIASKIDEDADIGESYRVHQFRLKTLSRLSLGLPDSQKALISSRFNDFTLKLF